MTIALFQPILNASAIPIFFPAPSRSDVYNCNEFYSRVSNADIPPPLSDCRKAFKMLPIGTIATPWWRNPGSEIDNILPIKVHHGECEIVFHTSGPDYQVQDPTWIVPNDIRDMASWVLGKCVFLKQGGMVTKNLANSIDYVTNTSINFWDKPFRASTSVPVRASHFTNANACVAASMSFYSLHIWNYLGSEDEGVDWNPGDSDPDVANKIADAVKLASLAARGDERDELDGRLDYIQEAEMSMDWDEGRRVWWKLSPRLAQPGRNVSLNLGSGGSGSTGNLTVADRHDNGTNLLVSEKAAKARLQE